MWGAFSWALLVIGAGALLWRLVGLEQAPFIQDEPKFLEAAHEQLLTHVPRMRSSVVGTSGLYYGGSVFWFYGLVQLIFGSAALTAIRAMALVVTLSQGFFVFCAVRAVTGATHWLDLFRGSRRFILGLALLLTASSAHQFVWTRLAWDQLTDAVAFIVAGLVLTLEGRGLLRSMLIGALLGFGISSHPMIAPFALLAGLAMVAGSGRFDWKHALYRGLLLGFSALAVLAPWLHELWLQRGQPINFTQSEPLTRLRWLEVVRAPGVAGIEYFFDSDWASFAPAQWLTLASISQCLWLAFSILGVGALWRLKGPRPALLLLGTLLAYPLFYASRGIPVQPHYQFPVGWAPLLGAFALISLQHRVLRRVFTGAVLSLAVGQLTFVASWRSWLEHRTGTRGVHYGIPVGEQQRVIELLCTHQPSAPLLVTVEVVAFAPSFQYLAATAPSCAGKVISICGAGASCHRLQGDVTTARIGYAAAEGSALAVLFSR